MAFTVPTSADLKLRYPAFADVDDDVITYWITDAQRFVDTSWNDADYAPALLSLAAHNMALAGIVPDGAAVTGVAPGVTRLQSGSMSVSLTEAAANALVTGGYAATSYGQEFQLLLERNRAGPRVSDTGCVPAFGYDFGYPYPFGFGYPY